MEGSGRSRKGRAGPAAVRPRGAEVFAAPRGRPWRAELGDLGFSRQGGRSPATPSLAPPAPSSEGAQSGGRLLGPRSESGKAQRPGKRRTALATVGMSARGSRGLASITAGLPRPPCWEETTRHAASERLQRRKRWRWLVLPALSGGLRRQGAEGCAGGAELQLYGGPAGPRRLPRSPAGRRGVWRAAASCCGAVGALAPAVGLWPLSDPCSHRWTRLLATLHPLLRLSRDPVGGSAAPSASGIPKHLRSPF